MTKGSASERSPWTFFALVFALSTPLWLLGAVRPSQLLPGLPVSSLMAFCPLLAALILVYRRSRADGVIELLGRSLDHRRIAAKVWYLPTVLLMPAIAVAAYGLMRLVQLPLPAPQLAILPALIMFLAFLVAALGEEIGWMGYAFDPMQDRWGALRASLVLGLIWAIWHIVPLSQAQRPFAWIAWWFLFTVAARVLIGWIYNRTGRSVFAAALFHASVNLSWQLFPNNGSHWDPRVFGIITAAVALTVTVVWEARTLDRNQAVDPSPSR